MELKNQVCTLESAKRLKELGVKQESAFCWVKGEMEYGYEGEWNINDSAEYFIFTETLFYRPHSVDFSVEHEGGNADLDTKEGNLQWEKAQKKHDKELKRRSKEVYSAFTVAELGEILRRYGNFLSGQGLDGIEGGWWCAKFSLPEFEIWGDTCVGADTEAEARAKMLIYLLENKLI